MEFVQNFPFFTIIMTLSSGVICSLLKGKKAKYFGLSVLVVVFILSLMTLLFVVSTNEAYNYMMGHFPAPWGNEIRVGVLEGIFATAFSGIMILSLLGGLKEVEDDVEHSKINLYYSLALLLMSSLLALVYTNDLFTSYVFVEINTIASCSLVMIRYKSGKALVATVRYLFMSLLGSGLFLIGTSIIYDLTGHLLMQNIQESVQVLFETGAYVFPLGVTMALFSMGLAIKSACFPFHSWLPDVYQHSTIASTTILSSIVSKGYIFLLIKIFYRMIGIENIFSSGATDILFIFGLIAMIFGSVKAMKKKDLKEMLAYSSVAQIGYIYLGIGLGTEIGLVAACLQILAHAITKPLLFVATGGIMRVSNGKKDFKSIQGAGFRDVWAGIAFVIGSLSMIGIPFFAGFSAKALLTVSAIEFESLKMFAALIVLAISTVLNAFYYIPVLFVLFTNKKNSESTESRKTLSYKFSIIGFIVLNFMLGVFGGQFNEMLQNGISMFK